MGQMRLGNNINGYIAHLESSLDSAKGRGLEERAAKLKEELARVKAYAKKNPEKVRRANLISKKEAAEERSKRASANASNKAMKRDNKRQKLKSLSKRGSGGGGGMNLASRGRSRSLLQQMKDASGPLNE